MRTYVTSLTGMFLLLLLLIFALKISNIHQYLNVPQSRKNNNTMDFPYAHHSDSPILGILLHLLPSFSVFLLASILKLKPQTSCPFHVHLLWPQGQSRFLASLNTQPITRLPYLSQKHLLKTGGRGKEPPAGRPPQPRRPLCFFSVDLFRKWSLFLYRNSHPLHLSVCLSVEFSFHQHVLCLFV